MGGGVISGGPEQCHCPLAGVDDGSKEVAKRSLMGHGAKAKDGHDRAPSLGGFGAQFGQRLFKKLFFVVKVTVGDEP